ncbi:hypothetical protein, partial [Streptomyces microflavus]
EPGTTRTGDHLDAGTTEPGTTRTGDHLDAGTTEPGTTRTGDHLDAGTMSKVGPREGSIPAQTDHGSRDTRDHGNPRPRDLHTVPRTGPTLSADRMAHARELARGILSTDSGRVSRRTLAMAGLTGNNAELGAISKALNEEIKAGTLTADVA